ncbi:MAG: lipopolysaccharide transport periplasmic protein LptA [Gammaproteobacteria bacterium]|jgi:lipopolysaccharide export system protein LptA
MFQTRLLLVTLLLCSLLPTAWALPSDRKQPIDIKADRVEVNQREQISHYIGNVHLVQGSLKIDANDVVVYMIRGKLQKIVISGNPAHFQQQPENHKGLVTSSAENMEYYASQQRLLLKHNAQVNQGPNHFRGDFIEYDTLTSTVKASKGPGSGSRVHAIIQPAGEKESNPPADANASKTKPGNPASAPATDKP